ncbi:MAG: efflux RND transporter periplasmic adaptor subunit [Desulfovibrionaceae bacterium]
MFVLLLAGVLLAGCQGEPQGPAARAVPEVSVVTLQPQKITLSTELSGRTAAYRVAEIRPRVNGLVQERLFEEGSDVEAGQILYKIDPTPFRAELNNAEADLGRALAQVPSVGARAKRYEELLGSGSLSRQDYDDAAAALNELRAEIKALRAAVDLARINLGYTEITAPIPGRIGKSTVTVGAIVTAYQSTALATIQQMDPMYVDVTQSTMELLRIKKRMARGDLGRDDQDHNAVQLILENGESYGLEGELQFSDVTVDQTTGSVTLRAVFPNPDSVLLPGMFVTAVVREGVDEQALLAPQQGVLRDHQGNPYALVVDGENMARSKELVIDRAMGDKWLVSSGLAPGDRMIVDGVQRVRPGMEVKATEAAADQQTGEQ